jgi:type I restriction enzyme, S subunit
MQGLRNRMSSRDWHEIRLGDVADILNGYAFKSKDFIDQGIPVIKIKNITPPIIDIKDVQNVSEDLYNEKQRYALQYNDILISMTGSGVNQIASAVGKVGRVRIKNKRLLLNQRVGKLVITNKEKCNYDFLYYFLIQDEIRYSLAASAGGSANQANISPAQIKNLKINIPPLTEQNKIAKMLVSLDEKIETNHQLKEKLEKMGQLIFKQWFVDFEFPDTNGDPYKSNGGEMVESERGTIPKGWEWNDLYSFADVIYGAAFKSKLFNETGEGLPLIRIRDLKTANPAFYTTEENKKGTVINVGDILVGMDAEFTPTIWFGKKGYLNQRVCLIKPNKDYIHNYFIYEVIKPYMKFFEHSKTGTTVIHLGKSDIDTIKVVLPPKDLLFHFKDLINPIYSKMLEVSKENFILNELRDNLLPKLISGEIRVPIEPE